MEITGKIIAVLPERSGTSPRTGTEWKVGSFVLETMDQYPRKMAFEVFGSDRLAQFNIQMGDFMTVYFDIDAHEYNGRWFNSIRAFRVDRNPQAAAMPGAAPQASFQAAPQAAPQVQATPQSAPLPTTAPAEFESGDDLPF